MNEVEPNLRAPSLFELASSDVLEGDFIAWLLGWAVRGGARTRPALHAIAVELVDALFLRASGESPGPRPAVRVARDVRGFDIFVEVGHDWALEILTTRRTAKQIRAIRASDRLVYDRDGGRARRAIIYLRLRDEGDFAAFEACGWTVADRRLLLEILGPRRSEDAFVGDFVAHLERLEDEPSAFRRLPVAAWSPVAWGGFFRELSSIFGGRWGWVKHARGSFWGYWWGTERVDDGSLHLRLEAGELVVRIDITEGRDRKAVREAWAARVCSVGGPIRFLRLGSMGSGPSVTVARAAGGYFRLGPGELVDLPATIAVLHRAMELVSFVVERERRGSRGPKPQLAEPLR